MQPSLFTNLDQLRTLPNDITISRHRGAATSIEANKRLDKYGDRAKVLEVIARRGNATLKEIAVELGREKNCISGRLSELLALKQIWFVKDERRDNGRVYRLK